MDKNENAANVKNRKDFIQKGIQIAMAASVTKPGK